jgi:tRNA (guanine-N7-)-methyltransferase
MAKIKLKRYEQVRHLPNVSFSGPETQDSCSYPWRNECYKDKKKILELGCGKGEHTLGLAAVNPGNLYIGIDSKSHRICVGAEKAIADGLENVHFFHTRIERLKEFFEKHSIHEIWLTFPDPHPKTREIKLRLTGPPFLDMYAYLLVPGGRVRLKTDSEIFCTFTKNSIKRWGGSVVEESDDIHGADCNILCSKDIVSNFENKAVLNGLTIKYMAFTLN